MRLEVLATRHRSLAVTACEWRAMGVADPELLADAVFERLSGLDDPSWVDFYYAVNAVVQAAYARQAASQNVLERLSTNLTLHGRPTPSDDTVRALSELRNKHRTVLQLRYWDSLTPTEAAEALQLSPERLAGLTARAETKFLTRLARHDAQAASGSPARLIAAAKPGKHTRRVEPAPVQQVDSGN